MEIDTIWSWYVQSYAGRLAVVLYVGVLVGFIAMIINQIIHRTSTTNISSDYFVRKELNAALRIKKLLQKFWWDSMKYIRFVTEFKGNWTTKPPQRRVIYPATWRAGCRRRQSRKVRRMQARARRLKCASQLQETKTVFARTKDSIRKIFSLSREAKNKFIHILNGKTTSAVWSPPALVFGLMKQLCLLAAGNPDAGRDDSGKKIDGLTWISPERALRMFERLTAAFLVKAKNGDEKKIDGSSKLRSAVHRCAQFARVGRIYSGVETCEGTTERFVETICLLSRKARNKFIHAMNGNTVDTKGRETAARKATTNVNKKWITFLAEMIDYDKKKEGACYFGKWQDKFERAHGRDQGGKNG